MKNDDSKPKIGAGHAEAMFRQGLSELRGAFYNESNVAQSPQLGLYGTRTPGEIADSRRPEERSPDEETKSALDARLEQVRQEPEEHKPERAEPERE